MNPLILIALGAFFWSKKRRTRPLPRHGLNERVDIGGVRLNPNAGAGPVIPGLGDGTIPDAAITRVCESLELSGAQCSSLRDAIANGLSFDDLANYGCAALPVNLPFCDEILSALLEGVLTPSPVTRKANINEALNGDCTRVVGGEETSVHCLEYANGCVPASDNPARSNCVPGTFSWCLHPWEDWNDDPDACPEPETHCGLFGC